MEIEVVKKDDLVNVIYNDAVNLDKYFFCNTRGLEIRTYKWTLLKSRYKSEFIDFLKKLICEDFYIVIKLKHFQGSEKRLILYGFDDNKKIFNICYLVNGKLKIDNILWQDLYQCYIDSDFEDIIVMRRSIYKKNVYEIFNVYSFIEKLNRYYLGESDIQYSNYYQNVFCGIECYKILDMLPYNQKINMCNDLLDMKLLLIDKLNVLFSIYPNSKINYDILDYVKLYKNMKDKCNIEYDDVLQEKNC